MRAPSLSLVLLCASLLACKPADPAAKGGHGGEEQAAAEGGEGAQADQPTRAELAERQVSPINGCAPAFAIIAGIEHALAGDEVQGAVLAKRIRDSESLAYMTAADERLGRMSETRPQDVALVEDWLTRLEAGSAEPASELLGVATQLRAVAFLDMRRTLGEVADERLRGAEAREAWAEAACLWTQALAPLAERADALEAEGGESWTGKWADTIQAGFNAGAKAIGEDTVAVKVAKQQIEKSLYAVMFRLIIDDAGQREAGASSEAYGLLDALDDRLSDRNSPGLRRMRAQLSGPPEALDPALFERELAVAFAKRARKYCDKAAVKGELGQADAIAETWEGIVYTRVILGLMRDALEPKGFDADAYLADWQRYLEAVKTRDETVAAEVSPRLVEWNCAYQALLGIAECTASEDESQ